MEELAARLTEIRRFADEGNPAAMRRSTRLLIRVAEQVGMLTFARVAGDVLRATDAGDPAAQAATLARLLRIGDRSLNAVWDLRDRTVCPAPWGLAGAGGRASVATGTDRRPAMPPAPFLAFADPAA